MRREASGSFTFRLQLIRQREKEKAEGGEALNGNLHLVCLLLMVQGKNLASPLPTM